MEAIYSFILAGIEEISNKKKEELYRVFGSEKAVFHATEKQLEHFLTPKQIAAFHKHKSLPWKQRYEEMLQKQIRYIPFYDAGYPQRLSHIPDRPFGIFVKGKLPDDDIKSIAIIGARDCSEYGRFLAEEFGETLSKAGVSIVSGMARGVDGIAMKSALKTGGCTYGVLGNGVDICYPESNRGLYEETVRRGGILSEYLPGSKPVSYHFPKRNRIISALSDLVLVVEARAKSGTLITVDMALEQGKDVYVVPGRVTDSLSEGCNRLILQGCGVALNPDQLLEEFGLCTNNIPSSLKQEMDGSALQLTLEQIELLQILSLDLKSLPQIMSRFPDSQYLKNFDVPHTIESLMKLVIAGLVKNEGSYYCLLHPISH